MNDPETKIPQLFAELVLVLLEEGYEVRYKEYESQFGIWDGAKKFFKLKASRKKNE